MDFTKLSHLMEHECQLVRTRPVVCGVSGGPDSVVLLHCLVRAGYAVTAAHFNHHLRANSTEDEQFVRELANQWGCRFMRGEASVAELALRERLPVEAAARKARYKFLFLVAENLDAQAVVVGHNGDDQVETVLMHLLRGSGLEGLRGMTYRTVLADFSQTIPVVRPLLGFWRSEIEAYREEQGLTSVLDESNRDTRFTRNRIRMELLPVLRSYNPQIEQRIWSMSQVVQSSMEIVDPAVEAAFQECRIESQAGGIWFSSNRFVHLTPAIAMYVLRRAARELLPEIENLDWQVLQRACQAVLSGQRSGQVDLCDGLYLQFAQEQFYLTKRDASILAPDWPVVKAGPVYHLEIPGEVELENGWKIVAERRAGAVGDTGWSDHPDWAFVDGDLTGEGLDIRAWNPGDRFQPLGMEAGSVKLADFFTNQKIPSPARATWPVVLRGSKVVWVCGLRVAHAYRVTVDTQNIVILRLAAVKTGG